MIDGWQLADIKPGRLTTAKLHSALYFWSLIGTREERWDSKQPSLISIHLFMCPFHQLVVAHHFTVWKPPTSWSFWIDVDLFRSLVLKAIVCLWSVWIWEQIFGSFVCPDHICIVIQSGTGPKFDWYRWYCYVLRFIEPEFRKK